MMGFLLRWCSRPHNAEKYNPNPNYWCRPVVATTAGTAMAIPVFVSIKKKKNESWAPPLTKASLLKPDSHMHES